MGKYEVPFPCSVMMMMCEKSQTPLATLPLKMRNPLNEMR